MNRTKSNIKNLPHRRHFRNKLIRNISAGFLVLVFSVSIGTFGYSHFFNLNLVDGLYNACMILTGMGPADPPPDNAAKIFSSMYAVYSGVAFLTSVAVIFAPIIHRFMHKFRIDIEE